MDAQEGRGIGPISGGAVVIALIVGAVFVQQLSFKGSRPKVPGEGVSPSVCLEVVQARLWEDPFEAVRRHRKDIEHDLYDIGSLAKQIIEKTSENKATEVIVLGAMVFGGPYAENLEGRLRSRYAILSGLGVLDYVPEDAEHVGYIEIHLDEPKDSKGVQQKSVPVPYEWFEPESGSKPMILLLWLNDDAFQRKPLTRIGNLKGEMDAKMKDMKLKKPPTVTFRILGPAGSTTLRAMIKEILSKRSGYEWNKLKGVQIFSSSATADDNLLFKKDDLEKYHNVTNLFKEKVGQGTFLRTIGTDKVLTDALVDELKLRGADPGDSRNCIALISEWDTFYGRALPQTFIRSVEEKSGEQEKPQKTSDKEEKPSRVRQFSYLRGIDGQLPDTPKSKASGSDSSDKQKKDKQTEAIERPVGRSQVDYLRRLATSLKNWNDMMIKREDKRGIKAIGILGSDVYDKLLVLQALRDRFPGAIFFTTDLNASLLHREEFKWTHNLVIASNFGLQLRPELQRGVPPFRDNYQTSLFFSTILAIDSRLKEILEQKTIKQWLKPSRIFEVSRSGGFDLSIDQENGKAEGLTVLSESLTSIHPPRPSSLPILNTVWTIVALLVGAVFFFSYTWLYRYYRAKSILLSPALYFSAFALFGAIVLAVIILSQVHQGEPFALFEGISIWPTEFLRFFSGVLSVYFLYTGYRKSQDSDDELSNFFVPKTIPSPRKSLAEDHASHGTVDAESLWMAYRQLSDPKSRVRRIIPSIIIYFVFCSSIILTFGRPFVPYRGNVCFWVDQIVLYFSVITLILLIFGVVDETRCSVWLIRRLSEKKTAWPQDTTRCFAKALNIDPSHVNDYISIRVIAKHSEVVGRFIYYPFLVMFVMLVSRTSYFDDWTLPIGLLIVILLGVVYAVYCAVILRRSAEQVRRKAVERLWEKQVHAKGQGDEAKHVTEQITLLLDSIRSIRQGAFVSFFQQPFVKAVVLFLGSGGSLLLIEYLPRIR